MRGGGEGIRKWVVNVSVGVSAKGVRVCVYGCNKMGMVGGMRMRGVRGAGVRVRGGAGEGEREGLGWG